jgi:hypothetical protein
MKLRFCSTLRQVETLDQLSSIRLAKMYFSLATIITIVPLLASATSVSLEKVFSISYGDGSEVFGTQYADTVKIGGLTATNQTLHVAIHYSPGFAASRFPADRLLDE